MINTRAVVLIIFGIVSCSFAIYQMTRVVYLHGPSFLGFWEGTSFEQVCAWITSTPTVMWTRSQNAEYCHDIIDRKVFSLFTIVLLIITLHFISILCSNLIFSTASARVLSTMTASLDL